MTVTTTRRSIEHTTIAGKLDYIYDFLVYSEGHMTVYLDDVLQSSWTIDGLGENNGGNVTLAADPGSGSTLRLERFVPAVQLSDYVPYDRFPADRVEIDLDLAAMRDQQTGDGGGAIQGEPNTASTPNAPGSNEAALTMTKVGFDLPFRKIIGGQNITITQNPDSVTISSFAAGNGAGSGDVQQTQGGRGGTNATGAIAFWGEVNGWDGKNIDGDIVVNTQDVPGNYPRFQTETRLISGQPQYHIDNIVTKTGNETFTGTKVFNRGVGRAIATDTVVGFIHQNWQVILDLFPDYDATKTAAIDSGRWGIRAKPKYDLLNSRARLTFYAADNSELQPAVERGFHLMHDNGAALLDAYLTVGLPVTQEGSAWEGMTVGDIRAENDLYVRGDYYQWDGANWVLFSGGGGGGHIIVNDGGADLTQRARLNFGPGLTASDNAGASRTDVDLRVTDLAAHSGVATTDQIIVDNAGVPARAQLDALGLMAVSVYDSTDDGVVDMAEATGFVATNTTGSTVNPGQLVRYDSNGNITALANASTGLWALAIVTENAIGNGASGRIVQLGLAINANTFGLAVGDNLYTGDAGAFSTTPVIGNDEYQPIGIVLRVGTSDGVIYFQGGSAEAVIPDAAVGALTMTDGNTHDITPLSAVTWEEIIPGAGDMTVIGQNVAAGANNGRLALDYSGATFPPGANSVDGQIVVTASLQTSDSSQEIDLTVGVNGAVVNDGFRAEIASGAGTHSAGTASTATIVLPATNLSDGDEISAFIRGTADLITIRALTVQFTQQGGGTGGAGGVTNHNDLQNRNASGAHSSDAVDNASTAPDGGLGTVTGALNELETNKAKLNKVGLLDDELVVYKTAGDELSSAGLTGTAITNHIGGGGAEHAVASGSAAGFMSSTDWTKLDGIEDFANAYQLGALTGDVTTPGSDSLVTTISAGAVTNAKLADAVANSLKGNPTGASAAPADLVITSITTGTAGAGDFVIGYLSTGELRKFDVSGFGGGSGSLTTVRLDSGPNVSIGRSRLNFIQADSNFLTIGVVDDPTNDEADITIGIGAEVALRNASNSFGAGTQTVQNMIFDDSAGFQQAAINVPSSQFRLRGTTDGTAVDRPLNVESTLLNLDQATGINNGVVVGEIGSPPTGGGQGAGTINAKGLYIDGVMVGPGGAGTVNTVDADTGSVGNPDTIKVVGGTNVTTVVTESPSGTAEVTINAAAAGGVTDPPSVKGELWSFDGADTASFGPAAADGMVVKSLAADATGLRFEHILGASATGSRVVQSQSNGSISEAGATYALTNLVTVAETQTISGAKTFSANVDTSGSAEVAEQGVNVLQPKADAAKTTSFSVDVSAGNTPVIVVGSAFTGTITAPIAGEGDAYLIFEAGAGVPTLSGFAPELGTAMAATKAATALVSRRNGTAYFIWGSQQA